MNQNAIYICISWNRKICWFLMKKCWCQQNSIGVSRDSYSFLIFLRSCMTVPSFIIVGYVWQILRTGAFCPPLPVYPWAAPKKPILNRVNEYVVQAFFVVVEFQICLIFMMSIISSSYYLLVWRSPKRSINESQP